MSRDFIKRGENSDGINKAREQQRDILYFIESEIQGDVTLKKLEVWADRNFQTETKFLEFVKLILKEENSLSVFNHLRFPLVSAQLVNDKIRPNFQRVFNADDSFAKYTVNGQSVEQPEELNAEIFNNKLLDALFFRFNDIVVTEIESTNKPIRKIIPIEKVVSIRYNDDKDCIERVAYKARLNDIDGTIYVDDSMYAFYPDEENIPHLEVDHDRGECPAKFVSDQSFFKYPIVRKSIFSFVKVNMENFVFLSTLQRMLDVNGAFPAVTILKSGESKKANRADRKGSNESQPSHANTFGSQEATKVSNESAKKISPHQAGAKTTVPLTFKNDGSIDTSYVQDFIKYHYIPVDILKFIEARIDKIKTEIVSDIVGSYSEVTKEAINEKQAGISLISIENNLRKFSSTLSRVIYSTELDHLALQFGKENVTVDGSLGTDFFLATTAEIYKMINESPNPIESRNLLGQLAKSKGSADNEKAKKDDIKYKLLPYATEKDFKSAVDANKVGEITFQFYTRFNYWIDLFEAQHGDLYEFWNLLDDAGMSDSLKLIRIDNLITQIIKSKHEKVSEPTPTH